MAKNKPQPYVIEVRIRTAAQLFNTIDPSPFPERDLDKKAEEFITGWAGEAPPGAPLEIHVHLTELPEAPDADGALPDGIRNYYSYREDQTRQRFRTLMAQGRLSLLIGLVFLSVCLWASKAVGGAGDGEMYRIAGEGLIIAGWVAMWRPMQTFLYDWWPLGRERRVYKRLAAARIRIIPPRRKG